MELLDTDASSDRGLSTPAVAAISAGVLVFAAALLRQEGVPKLDTLWAEDGAVFLRCAYERVSLGCVAEPYQGYLHVVPRIIAMIAAAAPATAVSMTVGFLAAFVAALASGAAGWSIAEVTGSRLAGFIGAAGMGLVSQAGREVLGNAANLHWVLLAAMIVVIGCVCLGAKVSRGAIVLAAATGLTSALSPVVAIGAVVPLLLRRRGAPVLFGVAATTAAIQLAVEVTNPRGLTPGVGPGVVEIARFVRSDVIGDGFFHEASPLAGLVVPGVLVALMVALVISSRRGGDGHGALLASIALVVAGVGVCAISIIVNRGMNPRYAYLPAVLVVGAIGLAGGSAAGALRRDPRRAWLAGFVLPAVAVVLGIGFAWSFRLEARASAGPSVPAQIAEARAVCTPGAVATIQISPRPASTDWLLRIPCARLSDP